MINSESIRKLLDLEPLVSALEMQELESDSLTLTFDERLQLAIDYLYQEKYDKKVHGLIKRANFRLPEADVTSIYYKKRELNQQVIQELARGNYLHRHRNVVFQGFTGSGKTYLACALGKEACKLEVRTRYIRLPDFLTFWSNAMKPHLNPVV